MTSPNSDEAFMREAIRLSEEAVRSGRGGPFGCVVVRAGSVVGRGSNQVTSTCDPTAHAEIVAIREACRALGTFQLADCTLYASCEPCPMCLSAVYWARIPSVFYGNSRKDAAAIGFDDEFIYSEIPLAPERRKVAMMPMLRGEAHSAFDQWLKKADRIAY
ncbi:MAG TPA: nucleoside deaminase [Opitutaceae bacterium]|nr:nucleoside deaminase [Opitutaceae bacterium]